MHATFPLGRPAGIRVGAHWSVLLIMALLADLLAQSVLPPAAPGLTAVEYWATGVTGAVVFFASLLAHELSHALVARHHGLAVDRITLWVLGGSTEMPGEPPTPRTAFAVAVAGPLASLAAAAGFLGAAVLLSSALPAVVVVTLTWLGWTNGLLAVFNLLPGAPLDGGRILQAAAWKLTGDKRRAQAISARSGKVLGLLVALAGAVEVLGFGSFSGIWLLAIGWFLGVTAQSELTAGPVRDLLTRIPVGAVMTTHPVTAPGWFTVQGFIDQAASGRFRTYPVVSFDGHPVGVISLAALARVPEQARTSTRLEDICRKPPAVTSGTPLSTVLGRVGRPGQDLLLVVDDGVLAGIVSPGDVARALELAMLGSQVHRPAG